MESPKPVIVAALFPEIHAELLSLLKSLSAEDSAKANCLSGVAGQGCCSPHSGWRNW